MPVMLTAMTPEQGAPVTAKIDCEILVFVENLQPT
jgi:hypothetical protein